MGSGSGIGVVGAVVLVPHPQRPTAVNVAVTVADAFEAAGCRVMLPQGLAPSEALAGRAVPEAAAADADLVVAIGGDGTLLGAFGRFPASPLVGVHCGHLGYLAEVEPAEVPELVRAATQGTLRTDDRLTLEARVDSSPAHTALNDIVVDKRAAGRVVKLGVVVDGEELTTLHADAVIVSTPTGSTAYNFSAGGPVVAPEVDAFCITPVAPHGLWNRSIVLGRSSSVRLSLRDDRPASVLADGRPIGDVGEGGVVEIGAGANPARLVHWEGRGVAERLRSAFGG